MSIFEQIEKKSHEQVVFCSDKHSGLRAIIAIHDTTLGPSLGGCRAWPYKSEEEALIDVLKLSRGMTYKSAAAGLNLGGGKSVIICDPAKIKAEILFRSFGRFVQSLGGRYITAEDMGTSVSDMEFVHMETDFVTGIRCDLGGSGDPSPITAFGVYHGIKASLHYLTGKDSLYGIRLAVQGLGHVGFHLIEHVISDGAIVVATDINSINIKRVVREYPSVKIVSPNDIYDVSCTVYVPCAFGGVVNDQTLSRLKCNIIAGSANNVLADEEKHSLALKKKNILYAPDFVISSGGLINVANELNGYNRKQALNKAAGIYDIITQIYNISGTENITTLSAAKTLAKRRINMLSNLQKTFIGLQLKQRGRGIS